MEPDLLRGICPLCKGKDLMEINTVDAGEFLSKSFECQACYSIFDMDYTLTGCRLEYDGTKSKKPLSADTE